LWHFRTTSTNFQKPRRSEMTDYVWSLLGKFISLRWPGH
jgi:hypothetical protein